MSVTRASWFAAACLVAGCGGGRERADVGLDTGSPDAGPPAPIVCGSIGASPSAWPSLPASCMPRCSNATESRVEECGDDGACVQAGLDADTTPSERVALGMERTVAIACGNAASDEFGCVGWQSRSCFADHCPAEFGRYLECERSVGGPEAAGTACASQVSALDACLMANASALAPCFDERIRPCFGA